MCSDIKYALITTVGILAVLATFGIIVCMN
ncbi:cytochrome bd-I oxidase subunit CydH [Gilliamella sp. ESL0250]|nr:YnhF family membrane protein [Gilliamella sp. ESL0250]NUF49961.1 YnhF family membrane protein [Gilliamella sp. ESL0250]